MVANFTRLSDPGSESSLRQRVEDAVQTAIIVGEMRPGELVSVPTLAASFGVSRSPVREALLDLERRHFVESVKNKGFRVIEASVRDVTELLDIRLLLEPPLARRLAGSIAPDGLAELRAIALRVRDFTRRGDFRARSEAELEFHERLTRFSENSRLTELIVELRLQTRLPDVESLLGQEVLERSADEHFVLVDLLEAGSGGDAEAALATHISHILEWFTAG